MEQTPKADAPLDSHATDEKAVSSNSDLSFIHHRFKIVKILFVNRETFLHPVDIQFQFLL